jgi:sorting nexin-4
MYVSFYSDGHRSVDNFSVMYEQIRVPPARKLASTSSPSDVTSSFLASPPLSPAAPKLQYEDIPDNPEDDQISDRTDVLEDEACWRVDPTAIRRRAMAEDFSEGKLETIVDSPQKENAGTQTQYVSYQVTTKVGVHECASIPVREAHLCCLVRLPIVPEV